MLFCMHSEGCIWILQEHESAAAMKSQPYRLLERSIFCDRMVFVESLKDSKMMSEMELTIYNSWCLPSPVLSPLYPPLPSSFGSQRSAKPSWLVGYGSKGGGRRYGIG